MSEDRDLSNDIIDAIDTAMSMVLESDGKFTQNTIIIPVPLIAFGGDYELVITFRKKADT